MIKDELDQRLQFKTVLSSFTVVIIQPEGGNAGLLKFLLYGLSMPGVLQRSEIEDNTVGMAGSEKTKSLFCTFSTE